MFITELIQQIGRDQTVDQAFVATRDALAKRSRNGQVPELVINSKETFSFDPDRPRTPLSKTESVADLASSNGDRASDRTSHEGESAFLAEQATSREFENARAKSTADAYQDFLKLHPTGPFSERARAEVARIDADARRAATDFAEAEAVGTVNAYRSFLERHPAGPLAEKARAAEARPVANEPRRKDQERQRLAELEERIHQNPQDEAAYYERGQFYAQRGDAPAAIADFDQSLRLNPTSPEALNNRCWMRAMAGDLKRALSDCNLALKLRPNFVDALDSRGLINLKAGSYQAAVADYSDALKVDPRHSSAFYGRGLARKRLGDVTQAERDIASALELNAQIDKEFDSYGLR